MTSNDTTPNYEALLRVADLVDKPKPIYMEEWATSLPIQGEFMQSCGYVACAIGHAALDPWFNEKGFRFNDRLNPEFDGDFGQWAVKAFFRIRSDDANYLFYPQSYKNATGANVAKRIREFVKTSIQNRE